MQRHAAGCHLQPHAPQRGVTCGSAQPAAAALHARQQHGSSRHKATSSTHALACRQHAPLASLRRHGRSAVALRAASKQQPSAAAAAAAAAAVDLDALGLEVPDIDAADIASYQQELGAEFDAAGVALTFHNTPKVLDALAQGVALADRSHWGRLRVAGRDRLELLHGQSTAAFKDGALAPGQGADTVFVTATGRCLDLATALVLDSSVMLLVSPSMRGPLLARLQGLIFPADDVSVTDVSARCRMLTLLGPQADDVLGELAGDAFALRDGLYGSHQLLKFGAGAPVILAVTTGLALPGYTLIVDEGAAAELYARLVNKGCVPMGEADWERLRVTQGRPAAGAELGPDYNPLEAGLCHAVSLSKGCYIGQETLAKVTNANGVKQQLWGLQLSGRAAPGAAVASEGGATQLGVLTSYANLEADGHFGLAYLKCRRAGQQVPLEGLTVRVDGLPARVVDLPYATRKLPTTAAAAAAAGSSSGEGAAGGDTLQDRAAAARAAKEAEQAAQAAAKAERLAAMQARLAAWQQQQQQGQQ